MPKRFSRDEREALLRVLRRLRTDAGLRQVDLAEKLGMQQSFVSRYESGERRLDVLELRHLCRTLEVSPARFFDLLEQEIECSRTRDS